jgi:hypothetical protein
MGQQLIVMFLNPLMIRLIPLYSLFSKYRLMVPSCPCVCASSEINCASYKALLNSRFSENLKEATQIFSLISAAASVQQCLKHLYGRGAQIFQNSVSHLKISRRQKGDTKKVPC